MFFDYLRGLVPPWFQGQDPTKHGLSTNNARLENLEESKLYKPALMQGNRCVVICDGKCNILCITSLQSISISNSVGKGFSHARKTGLLWFEEK